MMYSTSSWTRIDGRASLSVTPILDKTFVFVSLYLMVPSQMSFMIYNKTIFSFKNGDSGVWKMGFSLM